MSYFCNKCQKALKHLSDGKVGRTESCPYCSADLHVCNNCKFFDEASYNSCREPQADRVLDKAKSNFCDYFSFKQGEGVKSASDSKEEQMKKLDDLFK